MKRHTVYFEHEPEPRSALIYVKHSKAAGVAPPRRLCLVAPRACVGLADRCRSDQGSLSVPWLEPMRLFGMAPPSKREGTASYESVRRAAF
jgi:hypothetical protein